MRQEFGRWFDTRTAPWYVRVRCWLFGHRIDDRDDVAQFCYRCRGFRQRVVERDHSL